MIYLRIPRYYVGNIFKERFLTEVLLRYIRPYIYIYK